MPTAKKKIKKSISKSKDTRKPKTKDEKLEAFVESLDIQEMWEVFANSFNDNGTPKFKTVWSFISKHTKDTLERDILYWMLGPKVDVAANQKPKYNIDQYDWEDKRKRGFWYSSENIENLKADIHRKSSAYESIKQAGRVNVDTIAMLNGLLRQLEDEFGGRLFLPNLSMKENGMRATLYMGLVEKITTISNQAQTMFAKTQGLDLDRLDQFFQMFGTAMGRTAATLMGTSAEELTNGQGGHHLTNTFAKVVDMVTNKAMEYQMELPNNLAAAINEVSKEEASASAKSKKKVN